MAAGVGELTVESPTDERLQNGRRSTGQPGPQDREQRKPAPAEEERDTTQEERRHDHRRRAAQPEHRADERRAVGQGVVHRHLDPHVEPSLVRLTAIPQTEHAQGHDPDRHGGRGGAPRSRRKHERPGIGCDWHDVDATRAPTPVT